MIGRTRHLLVSDRQPDRGWSEDGFGVCRRWSDGRISECISTTRSVYSATVLCPHLYTGMPSRAWMRINAVRKNVVNFCFTETTSLLVFPTLLYDHGKRVSFPSCPGCIVCSPRLSPGRMLSRTTAHSRVKRTVGQSPYRG